MQELETLKANDAVWRGRFGDLGLIKKKWPVLGSLRGWRREDWPLPAFVRVDVISGDAVKVEFSDRNLQRKTEQPCDPTLANTYPADEFSGSGAVEIVLTKLLTGVVVRPRWLKGQTND